MNRNKILSLVLVLFSIFIFCGCANIEYQRITDDAGQIFDKLIIELNEKDILEKTSQDVLDALKKDIKQDLEDYVSVINYLKPQLQAVYPEMDFNEGIVAKAMPWVYSDNTTSRISVEVMYRNSDYLQKLSGTSQDEGDKEDSTEIVSNWFISKYMIYSDNVYMGLENMGTGGISYFDYYTSKYGDFTMDDVELTQVYGTTDKRLKSNADYKTTIDGINYHLWDVNTADGGYNSMQLTFYYTTAVGTGWYIIALSLSFALAIILIIVYIIKRIMARRYKQVIVLEDVIANKQDGEE